VAETFSQQFCSLARCGAGGRIAVGPRTRNCLVQVADGKLVIIKAPSVLLARVPAPMVEIRTPPGASTSTGYRSIVVTDLDRLRKMAYGS
jgi:hypothetical protein